MQTLLKADITGRVDYALYDLGARIVYERTSPSYTRASRYAILSFLFLLFSFSYFSFLSYFM